MHASSSLSSFVSPQLQQHLLQQQQQQQQPQSLMLSGVEDTQLEEGEVKYLNEYSRAVVVCGIVRLLNQEKNAVKANSSHDYWGSFSFSVYVYLCANIG